MIKEVAMCFLPFVLVLFLLAGIFYFLKRWRLNNLYCSRCGCLVKGTENIKMAGISTSYNICPECKEEGIIEPEEYEWACVLYELDRVAKIIDGYDVTTLIFWPKKNAQSRYGLNMDEIMSKVNEK